MSFLAPFLVPRRFVARRPAPPARALILLIQPVLNRIVSSIAREMPELFTRLGPHQHSRFLIDALDLPFLLLLRPDPEKPDLRAVSRHSEPASNARIAGRLRNMLGLIEGGRDGDALFFSRDLDITGNLEAVVCLRNAIDDVEGSIADRVALSLGPASSAAWRLMRRRYSGRVRGIRRD